MGRQVIADIPHLTIPAGELTVLAGPSGSGKSTLLYLLAGLLAPQKGSVAWGGVDLARQGEAARDRWRLANAGFIFQTFNLIDELSPLDNVLLPVWFGGTSAGARRERAQALLDRFGVPGNRSRAGLLSRGEQQRVAIARALLLDPKVIFADEPTASLDAATGAIVAETLDDLGAQRGPHGDRRLARSCRARSRAPRDPARPWPHRRAAGGDRSMMNPLPIVWASLLRNRFTAMLFVTLIALAVALGIAISAQERALRLGSARAADRFDLIVAAPGSHNDVLFSVVYLNPTAVELLPAEVTSKLLAEPRAAFAAPIGFGDNHDGAPVVGTTAAFIDHLSGGLAQGRAVRAHQRGRSWRPGGRPDRRSSGDRAWPRRPRRRRCRRCP